MKSGTFGMSWCLWLIDIIVIYSTRHANAQIVLYNSRIIIIIIISLDSPRESGSASIDVRLGQFQLNQSIRLQNEFDVVDDSELLHSDIVAAIGGIIQRFLYIVRESLQLLLMKQWNRGEPGTLRSKILGFIPRINLQRLIFSRKTCFDVKFLSFLGPP